MRPDVGMMAALMLPPVVRVVWVVVLIGAVAVSTQRAATTTGDSRLWHGTYAVMALGLTVMFAINPMVGPGPSPGAIVVLAAAALAAAGLAGWMIMNRDVGGFRLPWVFALIDLVLLAYIQVPSPNRPIILCTATAAYLAVQVVARAIAAFRVRREPAPAEDRTRTLVGAAGGPEPEPATTRSGRARSLPVAATRGAVLMPAAMSVLALGMLYMISI